MTRKGTTARKREEKRVVENLRGKAMTLARIMELFEDEKVSTSRGNEGLLMGANDSVPGSTNN